MATNRLKEALTIIKDTRYDKPIRAAAFAKRFWPDSNMHLKSSNQGHGATRGKAAWLCAGSYMGKLAAKGLVRRNYDLNGYYITKEGHDKLLTLN